MAANEDPDALHRQTRAIRGGRGASGSSLPPVLWPSAAFTTETAAEAQAMAQGSRASRFYGRFGNPTVAAFEELIADLEGAEAARAFASGMGALSNVVFGICSTGDHIVAMEQLYGATTQLLTAVCPRFGIDVTFVDGTDPDAWDAAIVPGKTMLCLAESPANPRLALVDLERFGSIAGPITVVDSTFATPLGQQPLAYGVDLVLHSATKGISGHNDATIGVIAGSEDLIDWLWGFSVLHGACASPFDALNATRGVRTLAARLRQQSESAQLIAEFLEADEGVSAVAYPGLPSFPQYELAQRQLATPGAQLTFDLVGGRDAGQAFVESTDVCQMATSLGGPETLVTHPATTTHAGLLPDEMIAAGIGDGTIRMSVGLEHPDDLIADIGASLGVAGS